MKILKYIVVLLLLLISTPVFGANIYFCSTGDNSDGSTPAKAYTSLDTLDNLSISSGDDVYFCYGETFTATKRIDIDFSGVSSANPSVIGCYVSEGNFDCTGYTRPTLQRYQNSNGMNTLQLSNDNEYLRFEHLKISNSNPNWDTNGLSSGGIGTDDGNGDKGHLIINDCYFDHTTHYALALWKMGDYNIITNNTFGSNGNAIYFIDDGTNGSDYNYIANNNCGTLRNLYGDDSHCVGFQDGEYTIIKNNTIPTAGTGAIVAWTGTSYPVSHVVITGNVISEAGGNGIQVSCNDLSSSVNNLVYGNIVNNSSQDSTYQGGITVYGSPNVSSGNRVFNNTIYNAARRGLSIRDSGAYVTNYNNIVHIANTNGYLTYASAASVSNMIYDYNLYWSGYGDPSSDDRWLPNTTAGAINFSEWQASPYNHGAHSSVANPYFNDADNEDFTLTASSTAAVDQGKWLTYVSQSGSSTTELYVADTRWFHGDYGLVDEDGNAISGQAITLYDTTNGLQYTTVNEITISHGTPGSFTVDDSIDYIYNGSYPNDPAYTTQVSVGTIYGTAPDIGAKELTGAVSATGTLTTGFQGSNITESQLVAGSVGGEDIDIILTIVGTTWVSTIGANNAITQALIDGLDSAQSETHGWNNEVRDVIDYTAVVRTSNTVVTITIPATATYDITANETITATIDATCVDSATEIVATGNLTISNETPPLEPSSNVGLSYSSTGKDFSHSTTGIDMTIGQ